MTLTTSTLNNDVSGDLFRLVEAESIALGRGRVQRLSKDATNAVVPCLTVDVQAAATLEATLVTASDPTLLPAGGAFVTYKSRVVASAEFESDSKDFPWGDLASRSLGHRVDEACFANAVTNATVATGAVLSAATLATAVAGLPAEGVSKAVLIAAPSQASAVHSLMLADGTIKGHEVLWSDQLPANTGALLMSPMNLLVITPPTPFSMSRDDQSGANHDRVGYTYRFRCFATTSPSAAIATFTDA
jgi:hypothetical protein